MGGIRCIKQKGLLLSKQPFVRMKGLEPPRLTSLDPKSSAATNYATCALASCFRICTAKVRLIFNSANFFQTFFHLSSKKHHFSPN